MRPCDATKPHPWHVDWAVAFIYEDVVEEASKESSYERGHKWYLVNQLYAPHFVWNVQLTQK